MKRGGGEEEEEEERQVVYAPNVPHLSAGPAEKGSRPKGQAPRAPTSGTRSADYRRALHQIQRRRRQPGNRPQIAPKEPYMTPKEPYTQKNPI